MKVSVIIPTLRPGEKLIDFQLPSFTEQTFPKEEFEIIIIDDCIDSRKEQVESFGKTNNLNVKWMRSKSPYYRCNANMGCARNTGLVHAKGKLVIFIDDFSYVKPKYIEKVWNLYKDNPIITHIGGITRLEYRNPPYPENIDELIKTKDPRHRLGICNCDQFFTANASAPLEDIIKVNGFWEIADLTREEDVLMGYALDRIGRKFYFVNDPDMSVYHMTHDAIPMQKGKFKEISYTDLGWDNVNIKGRLIMGLGGKGRCGLNTNPDEIQRVTKDIFNTETPGSWALIEHFKSNKTLKFNQEVGFDLLQERKNIGNI